MTRTEREWNSKRPTVPVDRDGNWLHYPTYEHAQWWTIEEPFYAELEVVKLNTGRSAKYVTMKDRYRGITYPMFVSDIIDMLKPNSGVKLDNGVLYGTWTASKRGQNYGIRRLK